MSSSTSVIPRESPEEGRENSSRTASSKESALNYRVVVWSDPPAMRDQRILNTKLCGDTNKSMGISDRVYEARAGRSAGGHKSDLLGRKKEEREKGDERILGSGDFVTTVLGDSCEAEARALKRLPLEVLSEKVALHFNIREEDLRSPVKKKPVTEARAAFGCLASA